MFCCMFCLSASGELTFSAACSDKQSCQDSDFHLLSASVCIPPLKVLQNIKNLFPLVFLNISSTCLGIFQKDTTFSNLSLNSLGLLGLLLSNL